MSNFVDYSQLIGLNQTDIDRARMQAQREYEDAVKSAEGALQVAGRDASARTVVGGPAVGISQVASYGDYVKKRTQAEAAYATLTKGKGGVGVSSFLNGAAADASAKATDFDAEESAMGTWSAADSKARNDAKAEKDRIAGEEKKRQDDEDRRRADGQTAADRKRMEQLFQQLPGEYGLDFGVFDQVGGGVDNMLHLSNMGDDVDKRNAERNKRLALRHIGEMANVGYGKLKNWGSNHADQYKWKELADLYSKYGGDNTFSGMWNNAKGDPDAPEPYTPETYAADHGAYWQWQKDNKFDGTIGNR
jgi:hypothetical protein